jgi:RNA recognition motif-containing protein
MRRTTDADLRKHFAVYGDISDCIIVTDLETKVSRGFGFVTVTTKEAAEEAISQCNAKEFKGLCPPHVRMSVKLAAKSKQQQEWEAKQKKAAESKAKASEGEGEDKEGKADKKKGGKKGKAAAAQAAEGSDAAGAPAGTLQVAVLVRGD